MPTGLAGLWQAAQAYKRPLFASASQRMKAARRPLVSARKTGTYRIAYALAPRSHYCLIQQLTP